MATETKTATAAGMATAMATRGMATDCVMPDRSRPFLRRGFS
jgi:hypothetical protein